MTVKSVMIWMIPFSKLALDPILKATKRLVLLLKKVFISTSDYIQQFSIVSNKKKTSKKLSKQEREEQEKSKKELELLLMDDDGQSKAPIHFSAKDVIKAEKSNKSRKQKKKLQKQSLDTQDSFKMDLSDPRFASLLEDHQFFIDPTNPQYDTF